MRAPIRSATVWLTLPIALCGCTQTGDFPSVAPRPIEALGTADPVPAPPAAVTPMPLPAALAAEVDRAATADADFNRELATARTAITAARGAAPGGEAWVAGQEALSRLQAARAPVAAALAALDQARVAGSADATALEAAFAQVEAIDARQRTVFDPLAATMITPA